MIIKIKEVFSAINNLIFSQNCVLCGKKTPQGICENCQNELLKVNSPYCLYCGHPLPEQTYNLFCVECNGHPRRFAFNCSREIFSYKDKVKILIKHFKYKKKKYLANYLGEKLAEKYTNFVQEEDKLKENYTAEYFLKYKKYFLPELNKIDIITFVPSTVYHLRERLFNPAEEIAKVFCAKLKLKLSMEILKKENIKISQVGLSKEERVKRIKGTFIVKNIAAVKNKNVLVIDDLITTGATLNEIAKVLKKTGANNVYGLCLAITVK